MPLEMLSTADLAFNIAAESEGKAEENVGGCCSGDRSLECVTAFTALQHDETCDNSLARN